MVDKELYRRIRLMVEKKVGRVIDETDTMDNIGLDSLEYIKLIVSIEKDFSIEFPIDSLSIQAIKSFKDFVILIENLCDTSNEYIKINDGKVEYEYKTI